ncbi:MAG TPA: arabinan endo-1,5-alpha-L-arabinosidase [Sphingomonas sp.]|nr:arabinan endo-1,5-alpha-L-arabinosidase [Sphingomonas sp.]
MTKVSMRWAMAVSLASVVALTGCGGSDGSSNSISVVPAPAPSPSPSPSPSPTPTPSGSGALALTGDISPVHDPAIIHSGGYYYIYSTSQVGEAPGLIPIRRSSDLHNWTLVGAVYQDIPQWAKDRVPGVSGIWAPTIWQEGGQYRLYYAVSTFGSNNSAIGMATSPTLDPDDPAYKWADQGIVIGSTTADNYNAIDPSIVADDQGREWMVFGSFWSGIKLVELDPTTGKPKGSPSSVYALAQRPLPDAEEAPVLVHHGNYYYLFLSYDYCCKGADSSYYTVVGRSIDITGPYEDKQGRKMTDGYAELLLGTHEDSTGRFVGPGSVSILDEGNQSYVVYHAYDSQRNGAPTLRIRPLTWGSDGWPVAD